MASARNAKRERGGGGKERASGLAQAWAYYRDAPQKPLYSLLFLFPIVAAYEAGALMLRPTAWPEINLVAQGVIQNVFGWFGADTPWLSGAAIVLVLTLLGWHVFSGASWRIRGWVPLLMAFESVVLTVPLFVINRLARESALHQALVNSSFDELKSNLLMCLGAALYEELVFRLGLLMLLMLILSHALHLPRAAAMSASILIAALVFALCHVQPVGAEPLIWTQFFARIAAGAYLSLVFLMRGLGISTGCHAAYNVMLVIGMVR